MKKLSDILFGSCHSFAFYTSKTDVDKAEINEKKYFINLHYGLIGP